MALVGSMKAQRLAEDLLGLDMQSSVPEASAYRGKYVEGIKGFYEKNKKPIMYVGGAVLIAGIAWWGYKMYKDKKNETPSA